jgi:hypothetical protein
MNEQIKQLMGRTLDEKFAGTWSVMDMQDLTKFADRLAELIVRECMEQVWYTREDGINGNVSEVIKDRIKQHFGVEE